MKQSFTSKIAVVGLVFSLAACGSAGRIADIGKAPELTEIKNVEAPVIQNSLSQTVERQPVRTAVNPNSLFRTGAKAFFKDQRASRIGDILTVEINITDQAQIGNSTSRSRSTEEGAGLPNLFGLESVIPNLITGPNANGPTETAIRQAFDPSNLVTANADSAYAGTGNVNRSETIRLTVGATITDVLPNGNLVIRARQEVRVNFEKRELLLAGIIRPQDISSQNIIQSSQIAEARISYGGKGQITDVQQPRYGTQLYDIVFPF